MEPEHPVYSPPAAEGLAVEAYRRLRAEIGQALHDGVCQTLGGASLLAHVLAGQLEAGEAVTPADLGRLKTALDHARKEAQGLGKQFQALGQRPDGLMEAVGRLAASAADKVPCEFRCEEAVLVGDAGSAHALYLVAHEAVANALRHAEAKRLSITLAETHGRITLEVSDDGRGLDAAATGEGRGLRMMHWHAAQAEGNITISSELGRGTTVRCEVKG